MVMGVYDPLGLVSPALTAGQSYYFGDCTGQRVDKGWDADLPSSGATCCGQAGFKSLLSSTRRLSSLALRSLPRRWTALGLVGFGDASMSALCVAIYVVWTDINGKQHPRILTGKCRVAPLLGSTIPRGELQALVVLHRLISVVVEAFPFTFRSISTYSDSLCALGAMAKSTSALRPYFANRVLEVKRLREILLQKTDELAPISHIPGDQNPADLGTRGTVGVEDLGSRSRWQVGPEFLAEAYEKVAQDDRHKRLGRKYPGGRSPSYVRDREPRRGVKEPKPCRRPGARSRDRIQAG